MLLRQFVRCLRLVFCLAFLPRGGREIWVILDERERADAIDAHEGQHVQDMVRAHSQPFGNGHHWTVGPLDSCRVVDRCLRHTINVFRFTYTSNTLGVCVLRRFWCLFFIKD